MTNKVLTPKSDLEVRMGCLALAMKHKKSGHSPAGAKVVDLAREFYGFVMYEPQAEAGDGSSTTMEDNDA